MRPVDRRTLLRAGAGALAAVSAPALLAGCGDDEPGPVTRAITARSIAIDYASYYPPVERLRELMSEHAARRGAHLTFSSDAAGAAAQSAQFARLTGEQSGFRVAVVAPFDATAIDPLAAAAIARGVQIVTYGAPLARTSTSAAVATDPARSARLLAGHLSAWAGGGGAPDGADVLIVRPPERSPTPDPFAVRGRPWEAALLAELERRAPALRAVAATTAQAAADAQAAVARALEDYPRVRVVLAWNDSAAAGAAQALRAA
ncbi:substrate-binding domain-containing protein, partial [Conexibacter sp. JD483]|uniref:substrate-binding domain-containing protein n=3 Tax=Conexibacter TaxID=191494 RepID=UPI00286FD65E